MNDDRILRDRLEAFGADFDNAQAGDAPACSAAMVAQTTTVSSYPTTPQAMYAVVPCDVDAPDTEGASASYVPRSGALAFAFNAGAAVPPSGAVVLCHAVGGRWIFRFD